MSRLTWLRRLSGFIDQHRSKLELCQPRITASDTSRADDIRSIEDVPFGVPDEIPVPPLILRTQLALLGLELNEFLQVAVRGCARYLIVQGKERNGRVERFTRLGCQSHDLESGAVNLFGELIDGNVGWRDDEDLTGIHLGQMVDNGCRCDGLSRSWRALQRSQRLSTEGQSDLPG